MFTIEYSLYEDPIFEGIKECNSLEEVNTWIGVMEGLMSYYHIYDMNGNEID